MDGRGRVVGESLAEGKGGPLLAAAAQLLRRAGAVGHVESRLVGGKGRARPLPRAADRRCH